jgi:hypothetical protein
MAVDTEAIHSFLPTGCSAAWLARVLWVPRGHLSNPSEIAAVTCAFDARGCGDSNGALGASLETPRCAQTVASGAG